MRRMVIAALLAALLAAAGAQGGSGRFAVESVATDGSGLLRLAVGPNPLQSPAFSPDGRTVAFVRDAAAVEVVGSDGVGERTVADFLTSPTYTVAFGPLWSQDGRTLIVPALVRPGPDPRNASAQLFAIDVAAGSLSTPHAGRFVSYSHDGRYIAYQTQGPPADRFRDVVGVCRPDGTRDVVFGPGSYAAWSPTDDRLAYVTKPGYLTVTDTANHRRWSLRTMKAGPEAWLPNGKEIAFARIGPRSALFLVAPGRKPRKVVDLPSNAGGSVSVSPNGRWIAVSSDTMTFLVRSDGTRLTAIQATGAAWSPTTTTALALVSGHGLSVWTPAGGRAGVYAAPGSLSEPTWSPDGKRILMVESGL